MVLITGPSRTADIEQILVRGVHGKQIPAVEILLNTSLIADQIKNDELDKIRESIEKSVSAGSQTFEQALYKLFKKQLITKEEALRNADSASNMSSLIDYSQTTKMKSYDEASQPESSPPPEQPAPAPSADFQGIKLNIELPDENK